MPIKITIK